MKKYESLLTKVELFHRLAMYGDRKAFLQALAQDQTGLNTQLTEAAQQFLNDIQGRWDQIKFKNNITMPFMRLQSLINRSKNIGDSKSLQQVPRLMDELLGAVQSENVMPEAMGALHQLRESAGVAANQMGQTAPFAPAEETSQDRYSRLVQKYHNMNAPAKSDTLNYGDPKTVELLQTFLASSLGIDALGPKGIDGKMGPATTTALKQWAKSNGVTSQDVGQLMQIALNKANYEQKAKV